MSLEREKELGYRHGHVRWEVIQVIFPFSEIIGRHWRSGKDRACVGVYPQYSSSMLDWSQCEVVEHRPDVQSGAWVFREFASPNQAVPTKPAGALRR